MSDPRNFVTSSPFSCERERGRYHLHGAWADWPEVVEFARAILAADEAWLDSQTPTLEELRAKYPAWCPSLAKEFWDTRGVRGVLDVVDCSGDSGCRFTVGPWGTERDALRWLAAKLEELTDGE